MHARKSLGQNFLMHARIAERIALVAEIASDVTVLEIGPGTGILTRELLKLAGKVIAIEADSELFEKLKTDFASEISDCRLELVHGDIRDYPLNTTTVLNRGYQVVANIPYYLTGEIFRMFLEAKHQPNSMTLLVQKEVADRIVARKESILSLSVKAYGTPKREFLVPRGAFVPAPNVDSAVLTVRSISRKNFSTKAEEERFFALIHAGFAHKRKFVRSNLKKFISEKALWAAEVRGGARAEDLSLSTWLALCR
ncbi:ribosomal RNA small subunit methyltransferase A [Candidatus Kaiserbacteria bacterium]|nr:ribosomal RNA small subunit methyltransferase A [Candidatus Kaiserbacteria bacterium]